MKILDLANIGYKNTPKKDITKLTVDIDYNDILGLSMDNFNKLVYSKMNEIGTAINNCGEKACWLVVNVRDAAIKKEEYIAARQSIGDAVAGYLIIDEPRDREGRLAIPSGLVAKISKIKFLQMVNRKTKIDNIICFVTINGKTERIF